MLNVNDPRRVQNPNQPGQPPPQQPQMPQGMGTMTGYGMGQFGGYGGAGPQYGTQFGGYGMGMPGGMGFQPQFPQQQGGQMRPGPFSSRDGMGMGAQPQSPQQRPRSGLFGSGQMSDLPGGQSDWMWQTMGGEQYQDKPVGWGMENDPQYQSILDQYNAHMQQGEPLRSGSSFDQRKAWRAKKERMANDLRMYEQQKAYENFSQQMMNTGNSDWAGQVGQMDMGYNPSQQWGNVNQGMNQMGQMAGQGTADYWNQNQGNFQFPGGGGQFPPQAPGKFGGPQISQPGMMGGAMGMGGGPQFPQQMPGQYGPGQNAGYMDAPPQGPPQAPSAMNMGATQAQGMNAGGMGTGQQPSMPTGNMGMQPGQTAPFGQEGRRTDYLNNYLQQGQPDLGLGITQPNVGGTPQSPDFAGSVQGDMSSIGQRSAEGQLALADQQAAMQGILDPETRAKLMAPAEQRSRDIAAQESQRLMEAGNALGFNRNYQEGMSRDIAQSASKPLIQAEAGLISQGLDRQMQARAQAGQLYGEGAGREYQQGLGQKELNLGAASQAGNFKLGQGTFNLNKGRLNLDAQQVMQGGKLTANGQRIQEQLGKAGLDLNKYKTDKGYDLEEAKFDFTKQLETRGMNLRERMQASDEFYQGLGMSMDAQSRDFQRTQTMTEMMQNQAEWDDKTRFQYKGMELEGMLTAAGIDSQNAQWAGTLAANILTGREQMDHEMTIFLKQLEADSGGSWFSDLFSGYIGKIAGGLGPNPEAGAAAAGGGV